MPKPSDRKGARRWTLQDAKNRFSEVVTHAAKGAPQIVSRRGVETAVVISHAEYERLTAPAPKSLAEHLLRLPRSRGAAPFERVHLRPRDAGF